MHALKNLRIKGNPLNLSPEELAALVKLSSMSSVKDMAYTSSLRLQQAKKKRTGGTKERRENLVFGVAPERLLEIDVELTGTPSVLPRFFQRAIVHVITAGTVRNSCQVKSHYHTLTLFPSLSHRCRARIRRSVPHRWSQEPNDRAH